MKTRNLIAGLVLLSLSFTPGSGRSAETSPVAAVALPAASDARASTREQQQQLNVAVEQDYRRVLDESSRRQAGAQDRQKDRQNYAVALAAQVDASSVDAATANTFDARTGTAIMTTGDGKKVRLQQIVNRARGSDQSLIVASSVMEPGKRAEMTEDLTVMAKLVDDAIVEQRDASVPKAMGINVSGYFPDGAAPRSLYIDGHGVIFQTAVRFLLKAPEKKEATTTQKPAKNSPWDEARHDLYGGREEEATGWSSTGEGKMEEYSEERVETLKKDILKALANANNFRHLRNDETVTVVVRGGGSSRRFPVAQPLKVPSTGGSASSSGYTYRLGSVSGDWAGLAPVIGEQTTMTIRVKKSDADALANAKITENEFGKRATVAVY